jgi:hypothetical protein
VPCAGRLLPRDPDFLIGFHSSERLRERVRDPGGLHLLHTDQQEHIHTV